jgi:Tfp pilus assembly protein PilV
MITSLLAPKSSRGFSLVEVVLALGIVVFALFSMVGLLGVGLQNTQDSRERVQAATIAEQICSIRRAAPTTDLTSVQPNFPLPVLQTAANNLTSPIWVTRDGVVTTQGNADFGFIYSITPRFDSVPANTANGVSQVYLCLFWPPRASPTAASTGHYEITTTFGLK